MDISINPVFHMGKLRLKKISLLAQSHAVSKWWNPNPGPGDPTPELLMRA